MSESAFDRLRRGLVGGGEKMRGQMAELTAFLEREHPKPDEAERLATHHAEQVAAGYRMCQATTPSWYGGPPVVCTQRARDGDEYCWRHDGFEMLDPDGIVD